MTITTCPYCGDEARAVTGGELYPHRLDLYGLKFYQCAPCDAYVGTHKTSGAPLGTLANRELRAARNAAHKVFDPLWRNNPKLSRTKAYLWLARAMDMPVEKTHIALFDVEQCRRVVQLCAQLRAEMRSKADA